MLRAESLNRLHGGGGGGGGAASPPVLPPSNAYHQAATTPNPEIAGSYRHEQNPFGSQDDSMMQKSQFTSMAEKAFLQGANPRMVFDLILRASENPSYATSNSGMMVSKRRQTLMSDQRSEVSNMSRTSQLQHADRLIK